MVRSGGGKCRPTDRKKGALGLLSISLSSVVTFASLGDWLRAATYDSFFKSCR